MAAQIIQRISPNGIMPTMELKAKTKTRVDNLITNQPVNTSNPQADTEAVAATFRNHSAITLIHGSSKAHDGNGFRFIYHPRDPSDPVRFQDVIKSYIISIPGTKTCAFCNWDTNLVGNFERLLAEVGTGVSPNIWAAFAKSPNLPADPPYVFVMSAQHLPHLIDDIPRDMVFEGSGWRQWLHEWLQYFIRPTRYLDITDHGVVYTNPPPAPEPEPTPTPSAVLEEVLPEELQIEPVAKKKKKKK